MHPTRMIGIEFHRATYDRGAALELACVDDLQSQDPERVAVKRIEGHRTLGRWTKRREVLAKEVRLRQRHHRELVRPIQLDSAPGRRQCPIKRGRVAPEAKRVFVDVDLCEAGPEVRLPSVTPRRALEPTLERRVSRGRDLLAIGKILELPLHRREIGVVFPPGRGPHRMNEHPVAIGDGCDDAGGDVILRRKNTRCLEVAIIGLSPELRSRLGVDQLSAHANAGTSFTDASFQHVTRAEFGTEGVLISSLSLQPRCRRARDN